MKKGLVMEGGAMRGIFTAGIIDVLMENGIEFDGGVGTSAGAAFGCNYKSRQPGRVIRYNCKCCHDWRFCSWRSLLTTGDLYGAEFCYHTVPEVLDPFDWHAYKDNPMLFYAVCTDVTNGQAIYHECPDVSPSTLEWIRASASMPLVSRIVEIDGYKLLDGSLSDSIPLRFFEEQGYQRLVVILTQPLGYVKKPNPFTPLMRLIYRRYPQLIKAIAERHLMYNEQTSYVRQREQSGDIFVLRPPEPVKVGMIHNTEEGLRRAYELGRDTMSAKLEALKEYLS